MNKSRLLLLLVIIALLPFALALLPIILPVGLIYLFAAINLRQGYGNLFCGSPKPTVRGRIIESLESKGMPVPAWLRKQPKTC